MSRHYQPKKVAYVVWVGRQTGVFYNWNDCALSVIGFEGAKYKGFTTEEAARKAFTEGHETYVKQKKDHGRASPHQGRLNLKGIDDRARMLVAKGTGCSTITCPKAECTHPNCLCN